MTTLASCYHTRRPKSTPCRPPRPPPCLLRAGQAGKGRGATASGSGQCGVQLQGASSGCIARFYYPESYREGAFSRALLSQDVHSLPAIRCLATPPRPTPPQDALPPAGTRIGVMFGREVRLPEPGAELDLVRPLVAPSPVVQHHRACMGAVKAHAWIPPTAGQQMPNWRAWDWWKERPGMHGCPSLFTFHGTSAQLGPSHMAPIIP